MMDIGKASLVASTMIGALYMFYLGYDGVYKKGRDDWGWIWFGWLMVGVALLHIFVFEQMEQAVNSLG